MIAHGERTALSVFTDFADRQTFKPAELHVSIVGEMLNLLVIWSAALKPVRSK